MDPNTTSHNQPCDQGIINSFKCFYKDTNLRRTINQIYNETQIKKSDVKETIYLIVKSWRQVTIQTIINCWNHCQILFDCSPISKEIQALMNIEFQDSISSMTNLIEKINLSRFAYTD